MVVMKNKDRIEIEWRKVRRRLQRDGALKASKDASILIRKGKFPLPISYRLGKYLLKRGHFEAAGILLDSARRFGTPNPLMDQMYGKWLWCMNKRDAAFRYVARKAAFWRAPYLYYLLSTFCSIDGDEGMADRCLQAAKYLARKELA